MSPQSVTVTAARSQTAPQSRQGIFHGYYFPTIRMRARFSHSSSYCPCLSLRGIFSFFLFSLHANKIFDNSSHASKSCYLEKRRIPWQFTKITTSSSKSFACRETLICCWVSREAQQFFFLIFWIDIPSPHLHWTQNSRVEFSVLLLTCNRTRLRLTAAVLLPPFFFECSLCSPPYHHEGRSHRCG